MAEWPDYHSYKALVEYGRLYETLMATKDAEIKKEICIRMIGITKEALIESKDFIQKEMAAYKASKEAIGVYYPDEYYTKDEHSFCNSIPFKTLAIIYEKEGKYAEAISICRYAQAYGFENDYTKGGMTGRINKLTKKLEQSAR